MKGVVTSSHLALLGLLVVLSSVQITQGDNDTVTCEQTTVGDPVHYFDNFTEVTYDVSCGLRCTLPVSQDPLRVTQIKVYFPPNRTEVNCSWVIPGFANSSWSSVMFFEQSKLQSLTHYVLCGQTPPSLTLWDEYTVNGDVQASYTICRDPDEDETQTKYSRRSSKLGNFSTLISLTGYNFRPGTNPVVLKYVTVDWSQLCFKDDYKEVVVGPLENTTTLGSQWFTSHLRLPNDMACKWRFSSPVSSNHMIRVRIVVIERSSVPGPCDRDDYVRLEDSDDDENFVLCDDASPFFFSSLSASINVDFHSGSSSGAPEFVMTSSALELCPQQERLSVEADLVENVVYGVLSSGQSRGACRWTLTTNWTHNVIMVTRVVSQTFQDPCTEQDRLDVNLGTTTTAVGLCDMNAVSLPVWSSGHDVALDLSTSSMSDRRVSVFYKSVPKVEACQGHPARLEASSSKQSSLLVETPLRIHHDVIATSCHWLVFPTSHMIDPDNQYAAEVVISDFLFEQENVDQNRTTTAWMTSGFRAYAGSDVNATSLLRVDCQFAKHGVRCRYLSTSHYLLLVYDFTQSTSPIPLRRISLGFQEVMKRASSGQAGSVWRHGCGSGLLLWHAQLMLLCVAVVMRFLAS